MAKSIKWEIKRAQKIIFLGQQLAVFERDLNRLKKRFKEILELNEKG